MDQNSQKNLLLEILLRQHPEASLYDEHWETILNGYVQKQKVSIFSRAGNIVKELWQKKPPVKPLV
jgi:hypothetical protein